MRTIFDDFIGKYGVSKTLSFELLPQGATLEWMEKKELLAEDEHRAESYEKVKQMMDEFHRFFIDDVLGDFRLAGLSEYVSLYEKPDKDEKEKADFEACQENLRKQIANAFKKHPVFSHLFSKDLIREELVNFYKGRKEVAYLQEFLHFTTYFKGFYDNRANIYVAEPISTSIGYRLIHQNLPKFLDNRKVFFQICNSPLHQVFGTLEENLKKYLPKCSVEKMFEIEAFSDYLTQEGIENYNLLLSGYSDEEGNKIQGLNEYIHLYNQKVPKCEQIGKLQPLYKQILSDRQGVSFIPKKFENDHEVVEALFKFYDAFAPVLGVRDNGQKSLMSLALQLEDFNLEHIYVRNDGSLKEISNQLFGDWSFVNKACESWYDQTYSGKKKAGTKAYMEERTKFFKRQDSFSIAFLNMCLSCVGSDVRIESYWTRFCDESGENFAMGIEKRYEAMEAVLRGFDHEEKKLMKSKRGIGVVKEFLDQVKELQWYLKPLLGKGSEGDKDSQFYGEFLPCYEVLQEMTLLYNQVRNYVTQKPYSTEKIKLNFSNAALLNGWSLSKEETNASMIFLKDGLYYLGIMDKGHRKVFSGELPSEGEVYQKMDLQLLPGANKMLPKVFFSKKGLEIYQPSEEILRIYKEGAFKKGANFSLEDCHKLIDFFKDSISIHEEWKHFGFVFSPTEDYEDISGFYREVEAQGYKINFRPVSRSYIDKLIDEGKFYFFQIYNKDFSPYSKGTPNLHTLYWKALFAPENLSDVVYQLNGNAEIFWRKASISEENLITHPANEPVANKNPLNPKKESLFSYTLYKDRRYTMDKFQLHVPITMNFKAKGFGRLNEEVNRCIKGTEDLHVIGINRGERHLLYVSVIDSKGTIVEQYSLNEIVNEYKGVTHRVDYHGLLEAKEQERDIARKNWDTIENIKELKEGYISQVVHKIVQLMVQYQAVIVMEDLNVGFLRGRQAIEKQVYQKFLKMLIDKLNYYVDKKLAPTENGGVLRAYQLTNKFESFQKIGKQNGFLFFAPSWYISNLDPTTGFVNLLYPKYENLPAAKQFFEKFEDIFYDAKEDYFCFSLDYTKFTDKAKETKTDWVLCSYGDRVITFRNKEKNMRWDYESVFPTVLLKDLFSRFGIDYRKNLQEQILAQDEKAFFEELCRILQLILQMRNFNKEADYLISPVRNAAGGFYDSREGKAGLPDNVEANAAYNIARKGLWMLEQIRGTEDEKLGKGMKFALTNQEWLKFAQGL